MDRSIWMFINKNNPEDVINIVGLSCARRIVSLMSEEEWSNWFVRKEGWPKVKLLASVAELTEGLSVQEEKTGTGVLTELPSYEEALIAEPHPAELSDPDEEEKTGRERRKHPRFDLKFRVVIIAEGRIFRTYTRNVSLGGVLIHAPIPDYLANKNCTVILGKFDSKETIETEAIFIGDQNESCRLQFEEEDSEEFQACLQNWIDQLRKDKAA